MATAGEQPLAPLSAGGAQDEIAGSYIVVLRSTSDFADGRDLSAASSAAVGRASALGVRPRHVYKYALSGYSAQLTPEQLDKVRRDPAVAYVAADAMMQLTDTQFP